MSFLFFITIDAHFGSILDSQEFLGLYVYSGACTHNDLFFKLNHTPDPFWRNLWVCIYIPEHAHMFQHVHALASLQTWFRSSFGSPEIDDFAQLEVIEQLFPSLNIGAGSTSHKFRSMHTHVSACARTCVKRHVLQQNCTHLKKWKQTTLLR